MAGNMSLEQGNTDKIVEYIDESRRMGLDVLPPNINTSNYRFYQLVYYSQSRYGLGGIRDG